MVALEDIRKRGEPLILYGSQLLAGRLFQFVSAFGVDVERIVVDRQYLEPGATLAGRPVSALEDLPQTQSYHCLVGFEPRDVSLTRARLQPYAKSILLYDVGYGMPDAGEGIPYYEDDFFIRHSHRLDTFAARLADDLSRTSLKNFLNQRISGEIGLYTKVYSPEHYFPPEIICVQPDTVFIDCGAYNGDTIATFLAQSPKKIQASYAHIHAFEPDSANFAALQSATQHLSNCTLHQKGLWSEPGWCSISGFASNASLVPQSEGAIALDSIDNVLRGEKASFIKMDIEGAELQALCGAARTISRYKPQLAISIYHKALDIFDIPEYILSLNPDYRLYVRAHAPTVTRELVLYAV